MPTLKPSAELKRNASGKSNTRTYDAARRRAGIGSRLGAHAKELATAKWPTLQFQLHRPLTRS
jgi:hypothetical protein